MINIEKILKEYKKKLSKIETIKIRIQSYEKALQEPEEWMNIVANTSKELGMPRGNSTNVSPVELEVINKEKTVAKIQKWIKEDEARLDLQEMEIKQLDSGLNSLTEQERSIVQWKYCENMFWRDIEIKFNNLYRGENYITTAQLKKLNRRALDQLIEILTPFYSRL
ncbi:hypothetical protein [Alkaliphilus transvaalensis]|uniref:hypothetical protein n=1 Tax=Alkaliphilus transvaalensis TaxID=114628 RepID=UPI0004797B79|nr:hypothetical protein [Alkaliphilus transvaalensis]